MGIQLASNFDVNAAVPLDSRMVVADATERDAILLGVRFEGMLVYVVADGTNYQLIGGVTNGDWAELSGGGGGGASDLDTIAQDTAETSQLADYTQTGLEILTTPTAALIHGTASYRLIHQAASTRSFKRIIAIDPKFRGKNVTLNFSVRSTAQGANVTTLVRDETNSADLSASAQVTTGSAAFTVATTNASAVITMASNSDYNTVSVGNSITGAGIASGSVIISKGSNNQVTLNQAATATSGSAAVSASILPARQQVSFDVPANCASISWTISALQEAGLPETYVDDVVVQLSSTAKTSAAITTTEYKGTDWVAYTPTFTGFGTVSAVSMFSRRVGDSLEIKGTFTPGTCTAVTAKMSLGFNGASGNVSISAAKFNGSGYNELAGVIVKSGNLDGGFYALYNRGVDTSAILFSYSNSSSPGTTTRLGNEVATSGQVFQIKSLSIPIEGWSATETKTQNIDLTSAVLVTEPDSYLRLTNFTSTLASSANKIYSLVNANIRENVGDAIQYLDDTTNGARFIARKAGLFRFNFTVDVNASGSVGFSKNSVNLTTVFGGLPGNEQLTQGYDLTTSIAGVSTEANLAVGDIVRIHTDGQIGTGTTTNAILTIGYTGKTKILNPSSDQKIDIPTHELRMEGSSSRGGTDTQVVKFDTLTGIRGDAFSIVSNSTNGTIIEIKKAGTLSATASLQGASAAAMWLTRNQTNLTSNPPIAAENLATDSVQGAGQMTAGWSGSVKVGDFIRVSCGINPTSAAINNLNLLLQETKVAVALSNVVPQFVDGDSFLELQASNGYGSTNTTYRRFSNLLNSQNLGQDFTYTDSATLGASVTITKASTYTIVYTDSANVANDVYIRINGVTRGVSTNSASSVRATAVFSGPLAVGDVVNFIEASGNPVGVGAETRATISRIGKPSLTAVDVTPFVNLKTDEKQTLRLKGTNGFGSSATMVRRFLTVEDNSTGSVFNYSDDSVNGTSITFLKKATVRIVYTDGFNGGSQTQVLSKNVTNLTADPSTFTPIQTAATAYTPAASNSLNAVFVGAVDAGDVFRPQITNGASGSTKALFSVEAVADSTSIVSAAKTYRMSDLLANGTRVTGTDPANLGEYRTLYRATSSNGTLSDTIAPAIAPSIANGMFLNGSVAFNAAGSNTSPQLYRIFIGKNKQYSLSWHATTGRTGFICTDRILAVGSDEYGANVSYDPTTGVLELDAATVVNGGNTSRSLGTKVSNGVVNTGYFDVTVFESPFVSATFQRKIATIRDEKASGADGGTFTSGAYQTRVLNTTSDPSGIVTSLAGNAFVLQAGKYRIKANAPAFFVDQHKAKLRNVTDSTDVIVGQSSYASASGAALSSSVVEGVFSISSAKSFSILHRCTTTRASNGFGPASSYGDVEVYTTVEIERLGD